MYLGPGLDLLTLHTKSERRLVRFVMWSNSGPNFRWKETMDVLFTEL